MFEPLAAEFVVYVLVPAFLGLVLILSIAAIARPK